MLASGLQQREQRLSPTAGREVREPHGLLSSTEPDGRLVFRVARTAAGDELIALSGMDLVAVVPVGQRWDRLEIVT